ncbi:MAG: divalent cation tolerance protein CutA [Porphyrobacter sp.]|nr:divalent cation tolerance protein CutA [Porphyrobacter sp.]
MSGSGEGAALVWCPFPDADTARAVAGQLVEERLVACANLLGPIESLFLWNGVTESAAETGVLFKTAPAQLSATMERLGQLHPYETPAILGWPCAAHPATAAWLAQTCGGPAAGAQPED